MSAAVAFKTDWISSEEYLGIDRAAERGSEYLNGEMFLREPKSREHSQIMVSLSSVVGNQLRGKCCEAFDSQMRVKISNQNFSYPDLTVSCGANWEDEHFDILLNPVVIFEVLSPSNEAWDRGGKFREYQKISSLREYVLISQDKPLIEIYSRRDIGWLYRAAKGRDASIILESIEGVQLPLTEIYERVVFEDEEFQAVN